MKNTFIILLVALFVPTVALADARLWGTWQGVDAEDGVLIVTFAEYGTFSMDSSEAADAFSFEELFGDMLYDLEMSLQELEALGFREPSIYRVSLHGTWAAQGDSIHAQLTNLLVFVEGWTPVWLSQYLVGVLSQMAALPLEDEIVEMLKLSIRFVPAMVNEMMAAEGNFIEEAYYFQGDQLVITSQEDGPLVLSRLEAPTTAVRSATWGHIKESRP